MVTGHSRHDAPRSSNRRRGSSGNGPRPCIFTWGVAASCAYSSDCMRTRDRKLTDHATMSSQSAPAPRVHLQRRGSRVEKAATRNLHCPSRHRRRGRLDNSVDHVVSLISLHMTGSGSGDLRRHHHRCQKAGFAAQDHLLQHLLAARYRRQVSEGDCLIAKPQ